MIQEFWSFCLTRLEQELPQQQFNTWIKTLRAEIAERADGAVLNLYAPNRFVLQWVRERYLRRITELADEFHAGPLAVELQLPAGGAARTVAPATGTAARAVTEGATTNRSESSAATEAAVATPPEAPPARPAAPAVIVPRAEPEPASAPTSALDIAYDKTRLNPDFTFDTLVTGRANDLARAAAMQVAQNPGTSYNPLFIYGGVGLGKARLVHAIGNAVFRHKPRAVIRYVH
ncbi:MAG: chromosomal replication initiator protein DnaA, partial [Proteobacteria bacterium]|nr:chromosomal replication initiator protein DnaA [Pseudomonadota bacterium]